MLILLFADNHFCETSSILRQKGIKYSSRLENQIDSLNWVEQMAAQFNCDAVIGLGDFFNMPTLTDMELTALADIKWNPDIIHYFLVGNHESAINDLSFNSTNALLGKNKFVINEPCWALEDNNTQIHFLPYILESNRQSLETYLDIDPKFKKQIILSHNDIKGIQLGPVCSKTGFTVEEIENACDLFINGHLHNGTKLTDKIINLGNLTGQNFSEDAFTYTHNIMLLNTDTLEYSLIENPFAFNFYKINVLKEQDLLSLSQLKNNAIVSVKSKQLFVQAISEIIKNTPNILEYRIISIQEPSLSGDIEVEQLQIEDPLVKFTEFCKSKLGDSPILDFELSEVCK